MKISDLLRLYFGKSAFKLLPISASFLYAEAVSIQDTYCVYQFVKIKINFLGVHWLFVIQQDLKDIVI